MSFTIHGIDKELDDRLAEWARRARVSKNQMVKNLLAQAVGLPGEEGSADCYREFCGLWTEAERDEFERAQSENELIDDADWQ